MESIHARFGRNACPIQLPLGSEKDFKGVIDLVRMKACVYTRMAMARARKPRFPPSTPRPRKTAHEELVETRRRRQRRSDGRVLREGHASGRTHHQRTRRRNARDAHFPRPLYVRPARYRLRPAARSHRRGFSVALRSARGEADSERQRNRTEISRRCSRPPRSSSRPPPTPSPAASLSSRCFRAASRTMPISVQRRKGTEERLAHIGAPFGKTIVPVTNSMRATSARWPKLKDTLTGDTLTDKSSPVAFPPVKLPEPSIAFAVEAKSRTDEDRMGNALHKLLEEDLSLRFYRDPQTQGFPGRRHRPAARRDRCQPAEETLRRRCHAQSAQDSLSRNHPRERRRPGASQEADRRPRAVWRLLDPDGASAARREIRVRQRGLRRLNSQKLYSSGGKRNYRDGRTGIIWRAIRWSISRLPFMTAPIMMSIRPNSHSSLPRAKLSAPPCRPPSRLCSNRS